MGSQDNTLTPLQQAQMQRSLMRMVKMLDTWNQHLFSGKEALPADTFKNFLTSEKLADLGFTFIKQLSVEWENHKNMLEPDSPLQPEPAPVAEPAPAITPARKPIAPMLQFHLPNGRVGQAYIGKIGLRQTEAGPAIQLQALEIPAACAGLHYKALDAELVGTPGSAGEFRITFQWRTSESDWADGHCTLIVNADPRSLWKVLPTVADDPYFKPDQDCDLIRNGAFNLAAASRRGRSHEHVGSFRDDDFFIAHQSTTGWSTLIVADGAGSAKHSRWGAKLAAHSAGQVLQTELARHSSALNGALDTWANHPETAFDALSNRFQQVFQSAAMAAITAIETEAQAQTQTTSVKDYATTLLVAAVKQHAGKTFIASFWIGDGAIAAYGPHNKVRLIGSPDSGEYAGQTRFLDRACLSAEQGFNGRISLGFFADIEAVIVMTDGVSDPRFETDNGLQNPDKWDSLWQELQPLLQQAQPEQALLEWLHFFTPGHHDDRTLALLWANRE